VQKNVYLYTPLISFEVLQFLLFLSDIVLILVTSISGFPKIAWASEIRNTLNEDIVHFKRLAFLVDKKPP